jgi:hypothetical protein
MNRWDWLRVLTGAVGGTQNSPTAPTIDPLGKMQEGFNRIAQQLDEFTTKIDSTLYEMRQELSGFTLAVNGKIRGIERRLEVLESILFEPDPARRNAKLHEHLYPKVPGETVLEWPNDKPAA